MSTNPHDPTEPTTPTFSGAPVPDVPAEPAPSSSDTGADETRPIALRKDSNVRAWLIFLGFLCLAVALWRPISRVYWSFKNRSLDKSDARHERTSDSFLAISYEGVTSEPIPGGNFISTQHFTDHLVALRDAGYTSITLEDVRAFYQDGKPLPSRALLLTFDDSRRSTYFETRDILSRFRWHATMGIATRPVREGSEDAILAPYLKDMALDATWNLACESDSGLDTIPSSPYGRTSPFYSAPQWLFQESRFETPDEFARRIEADHDTALSVFDRILGTRPIAFFYPLGNYGQYEQNNRRLRDANVKAVDDRYPLGFTLGMNALNEVGTDPLCLQRLRVDPKWSARELVETLENFWPVKVSRDKTKSDIAPDRWVADWGSYETVGSNIVLRSSAAADPLRSDDGATQGAHAWITGSSPFQDGTISVTFLLQRGSVYATFRCVDIDDWLRVTLSDTGDVFLLRSHPGGEIETLASDTVTQISDFRSLHSLNITLRGPLVFVRVDNELVFDGAVAAGPDTVHSGHVGFGVWDEVPGHAYATILECNLRARVDSVVTWDSALSKDAGYLSRKLHDNAFRYTIVAPPWMDLYGATPVDLPTLDPDTLDLVARANQAELCPGIVLHDAQSLSATSPEKVVKHLLDDPENSIPGATGLYLDASTFPVEDAPKLQAWLNGLRDAFAKREDGRTYRIALRTPPTSGRNVALSSLFSSMPEASVVSDDGRAPVGVGEDRVLGRVVIAPPTENDDLSLFYQLSRYNVPEIDAAAGNPITPRDRGLAAFRRSDYDEAIACWSEWVRSEPDNAEAVFLLGNAYARKPDTEHAVECYRQALALDPGNISLVLESVRLFEDGGQPREAAELLDRYARAFPDDTEIAVAQALWLNRRGHPDEASEILRDIVGRNPSDVQARMTLQGLLADPSERYANMHELLDLGAASDNQLIGFGAEVSSSELLAVPESSIFFDFIRNTATNAPIKQVRETYTGFLPMEDIVQEKFDANRLSERWIPFGAPVSGSGVYDLQASSNMVEAYLRLKNSELLRDGFVEVTVSESVGAFWLYARRSSRAMVRYGFDGDGFLRVQSWLNGTILTSNSRAWVRQPGDVTLRLEVRGSGVMGYVNGVPAFTTPLPIPREVAYGWWAIAPFSPELGVARARIVDIAAGPLSPAIVTLRETDSARINSILELLQPQTASISAISPVLFIQGPDGTVPEIPITDPMPFNMFCSYHRLRFMPAVALDFFSEFEPQKLVDLIHTHRLNGLVIYTRSLPSAEWFEQTSKLLETTDANVLVVQRDKPLWSPDDTEPLDTTPVLIREIQRGSVFVQPSRDKWYAAPEELTAAHPLPDAIGPGPRLYVAPHPIVPKAPVTGPVPEVPPPRIAPLTVPAVPAESSSAPVVLPVPVAE